MLQSSVQLRSTQYTLASSMPTLHHSVNDLVTWFNNHCASALDTIAPYKTRSLSTDNSRPWINDNICFLKREARRVEHSWKKSKSNQSMVHLLHLKELFSSLNQNITEVRIAYIADLIIHNKHSPRFLFNTIDRLVNPAHPAVSASSSLDCESWLSSFLNKINIIRSNFNNPTVSTDSPVHCPTLLSDFSPISLHSLIDIEFHMHLSSCPLDVMPPKFLKEVLPTLGPSLPSIMTDDFKIASIKPILKKPCSWPAAIFLF